MNQSLEPLELLSPAKNIETGFAAISHGADAVYIGGPGFGARANAGNSIADLEKLVKYAHQFRSRVYLTLNTILKDSELEAAVKLAKDAWNIGIDALIVQDLGLLMCDLPPIQLHASTQCDIRTPEKALFLEKAGFSQIVPARELNLEQISEMHNALNTARIEFFIHGALCVSYSGQCYASQVLKHRSANRGECSQICRLPFDVYDSEGQPLAFKEHVLSLKDNNQSDNLAALIGAGVRSFKIEGRYKDEVYVKNTTAHYRKLLDKFMAENQGFTKSSEGDVSFNFEPDVTNAFNRGSTDYFVNGRHQDIANFNSPKNTGEIVGQVLKVEENSIVVKSKQDFNNGDGLTFWKQDGELSGFLVNKAEKIPTANYAWRLHTREKTSRIYGLDNGISLMRNRDAAWLKKMAATTSLRKIPIKIQAEFSNNTIKVSAQDSQGNQAVITADDTFDAAKNPEAAKGNIERALGKLGNTIFSSKEIAVKGEKVSFLPASVINNLRRDVISKLVNMRLEKLEVLPQATPQTDNPYSDNDSKLDYHANVLNEKAKAFYEKHGVQIIEKALEDGHHSNPGTELMRCKHCIRYSMDLCPKEAIKRGEKIKPTPLTLKCGDISLTAKFHCKICEMSISLPE